MCVAVCPAKSKSEAKHRAINMEPQPALREKYNQYWDYFLPFLSYRVRSSPTAR